MTAGDRDRNLGTASVLWWVDVYTRNLPRLVAADRRAEVASDVYEHNAVLDRGRGWTIALRALKGVPNDLSWRRTVRRSADEENHVSLADRWERFGSTAVAAVLGLTVLAWGIYALVRVVSGVAGGAWLPGEDMWMSLIVGVLVEVCGLVLLARVATRWIGALWLAIASAVLIRYGMRAMLYVSTTAFSVTTTVPIADRANQLLVVFVCLFFGAIAVLWFGRPAPNVNRDDPLRGEDA